MGMTVGELVAYIDADDRGFDSGLAGAERRLMRLESVTTSTTGRIESTMSAGFARVADSIGDGLDPDAALADMSRLLDGVEQAMADVERAAGDGAGKAGQQAATRFWQDARGRWHDENGRFVSESSAMFDGVVNGAQRAGDATGKAFEGGLGVLSKAGPAHVAIAVGAIQALPAVAGIAAGGIVSALGGALLAVGLKSAAGADRVQDAWKKAVAEIKKETAEAAQPLEGSAIRAADVAQRAFERLKPSLSRIFKDLVPDVDRFVQMVGQGVGSLGPVLERLGDSFGDVLSELGNRMPVIIDNISAALTTFADIVDEDPQMLANLVQDATELLRVGAQVLSWADEIRAVFSLPFGPAGAQAGSDYFYKQIFGATPAEIQAGMEQLPMLLAKMRTEAAAGAAAIGGVGKDANTSADGVRNLSQALEEFFAPAQDALSASNNWSQALKDAEETLSKGKTSLLDRKMLLEDLLGTLAKKAATEKESTGATESSTKAFEQNAAMLVQLAGKSGEGKAALDGLATSLGYTIDRTKNATIFTDQLGNKIKILPNGKVVKIEADTGAADKKLDTTKGKIGDVKDKDVKINADVQKALTEVKKVTAGLNGLKGDATKAGADLGSGLVAGIRSMIGQAAAAAQNLAQSALNAVKNAMGIHSPSTVMAEVGRWTVKGLIQGLTEEEGRAVDTVKQMVEKIKEAFASTPDTKDHLLAFVTKGNDSLMALAKQREDLVARLAAAKEFAKQVAGDAKEWAAITGLSEEELNSGNFADALKNRAQAIKDFANNIQELARRGLNKETLRQIIEAGPEKGASIAEMLVGAPGSEIKAINKAQAQIDKMSKQLGKSGADALYDVGKKAGDGYLKGLQESLKQLDKEMAKIVKALVSAIKRELKIKSPSLVMAEIGGQTIAGLAVGMTAATDQAVTAVQAVAANVVSAAAGSLAGMMPATLAGATIGGQAAQAAQVGIAYGGGGVDYNTPAQPGRPGAGGVTVQIENATVREEADFGKLGAQFGFEYMAHA